MPDKRPESPIYKEPLEFTQIMLPESLKRRLEQEARSKGLQLGPWLRTLIIEHPGVREIWRPKA